MAAFVLCPDVVTESSGVLSCSSAWATLDSGQVVTTSEMTDAISLAIASFSQSVPVGIDPLEIAGVFSWGFATVVFFWYLGYQIRVAKMVIHKV